MSARTREEWHEDDGPVLWWAFPVEEPPYAGAPLDDDFPEYMTHWTPIEVPEEPCAAPDCVACEVRSCAGVDYGRKHTCNDARADRPTHAMNKEDSK